MVSRSTSSCNIGGNVFTQNAIMMEFYVPAMKRSMTQSHVHVLNNLTDLRQIQLHYEIMN